MIIDIGWAAPVVVVSVIVLIGAAWWMLVAVLKDRRQRNECRCGGTGWVQVDIPKQFQNNYSASTGWAGCNKHFMNADSEPPGDKR